MRYISTKVIPMGSTAFRQWRADSHCKLIHGYRLQCKLWFTADNLDENNWIYDFGGCKDIKKILEKQFDHTTVVAADDPELNTFKLMSDKGMIDLRIADKGVGIERTAEWVFENVNKFVTKQTNNRVKVMKVEVWEHEGNSAIYEETNTAMGKIVNSDEVIVNNNVESKKESEELPEEEHFEGKKYAAPLYQKKSSGIGNPFEGTSWG